MKRQNRSINNKPTISARAHSRERGGRAWLAIRSGAFRFRAVRTRADRVIADLIDSEARTAALEVRELLSLMPVERRGIPRGVCRVERASVCELSCETLRAAAKKKDKGICKMKRLICFFSEIANEREREREREM